jgi:hypothetical protein
MSDQPPLVVDHDNDRPPDHEPATDQETTDQRPVSLEEAAERLGITVNAVRQRLKRGTLQGKKTPAGWVVVVPTNLATTTDHGRSVSDQPSTTGRSATNRPPDQASIAPLAELIAELTRENRDLAAAAALWQERARFLGERLQALEAGPIAGDVEDTPRAHESGPQSGAVAAEVSDATPSAWRRWWRRMTGGGR